MKIKVGKTYLNSNTKQEIVIIKESDQVIFKNAAKDEVFYKVRGASKLSATYYLSSKNIEPIKKKFDAIDEAAAKNVEKLNETKSLEPDFKKEITNIVDEIINKEVTKIIDERVNLGIEKLKKKIKYDNKQIRKGKK